MNATLSTRRPAPNKLPTLFGRLTTLLCDHERLGNTLRRVEAMCVALDSGADRLPIDLDPARALGELRMILSRHFTAEESATHFGLIVCERPELLPQVVALKADHVELLAKAADIIRLAADTLRWCQVSAATRRLVSGLQAHEEAEADLVERFFATTDRWS